MTETRFDQGFIESLNPEHDPERSRQYEQSLIEHASEEFELNRVEIGRGKSAIVWKGTAPEFQKDLCFKTIHTYGVETNSLGGEFSIHQAFLKAGVRVPRLIAHVSDFQDGPFGRDGFLAMEQIHGKTIEEDIINRQAEGRPYSKTEVQTIVNDMDQQVKNAHQAQLHHRDLHLGNVMFNEESQVVVIDFGRARKVLASEEEADIYHGHIMQNGRLEDARFLSDRGLPTRFVDALRQHKLFPGS